MDPTYIDKILEEHNMSNIKSATTTGTHTIKRPDDGDKVLLTESTSDTALLESLHTIVMALLNS